MDIPPEYWYLWETSSSTPTPTRSQRRDARRRRRQHRLQHHHPYSGTGVENDDPPLRQDRKPQNSTRNKTEDNYSKEVGSLKLQMDKLPTTLPGSFFRREQGIPSSSQFTRIWEHQIMRQLIASRGSVGNVPVKAETHIIPVKKSINQCINPGNKWTRIRDATSAKGSLKFEFANDLIMIKDGGVNTRRFVLTNAPLQSPFLTKFVIEDSAKTKLKWRDHEISFIDMHNYQLNENSKILKLPNTLLVLEALKLVAYDLNNGKRLDELMLSFPKGPDHYSSVFVDDATANRIYISGNSVAVQKHNPDMCLELLVVSYPPLRVLSRLLFTKSGDFRGSEDISIYGDLLVVAKSTSVELFHLESVMEDNVEYRQLAISLDGMQSMSTVFLKHKPKAVAKLKSQSGYMICITDVSPPHVCLKTKDTFEIRRLDNLADMIWETPNKTLEGDVSILTYDNHRPRVVVTGLLHGFDIFQVDTVNRSMNLLFSTRDFEKEVAGQSAGGRDANTSRKRSLRQLVKKNYADMQQSRVFGFGYDAELELLAVCMVADGLLSTSILNNNDFKLFQQLTPVKLSLPTGTVELGCSNVNVAFNNEWSITVDLTLFDATNSKGGNFHEIYTASLFGEVVPED